MYLQPSSIYRGLSCGAASGLCGRNPLEKAVSLCCCCGEGSCMSATSGWFIMPFKPSALSIFLPSVNVLRSPTVPVNILDFSLHFRQFSFPVFGGSVLGACLSITVVSSWWTDLFMSIACPSWSLATVFVSESLWPDVSTVTPALFLVPAHMVNQFHHFTFSLSESLDLKCVFCWQHKVGSRCLYSSCQSIPVHQIV